MRFDLLFWYIRAKWVSGQDWLLNKISSSWTSFVEAHEKQSSWFSGGEDCSSRAGLTNEQMFENWKPARAQKTMVRTCLNFAHPINWTNYLTTTTTTASVQLSLSHPLCIRARGRKIHNNFEVNFEVETIYTIYVMYTYNTLCFQSTFTSPRLNTSSQSYWPPASPPNWL